MYPCLTTLFPLAASPILVGRLSLGDRYIPQRPQGTEPPSTSCMLPVPKRIDSAAAALALAGPKRTLTRTLPGSTVLFDTSAVTPLANSIRSARSPGSAVCDTIVPGAPNFGSWLKSASKIGRHTSELQSLMRISYAVFCLKKNNKSQIPKLSHEYRLRIKE